MRAKAHFCWPAAILLAGSLALGGQTACAQRPATSASLGGYGASAGGSGMSMGSTSPIIPYAGTFGGFMPYRMVSGPGALSFSRRDSSTIGSLRTPLRLSPMPAMTAAAGGMTAGTGAGPFSSFQLGPTFFGADEPRPSVAPPSFAYPFYQPFGATGLSSSGAGMPSM